MEAITKIEEGVLVDIEVSTNAEKFMITGYNEWRKAFEIKIKAIPQKGKANKEIILQFSRITNRNVELSSGHKSHHKTIKIYDINEKEILEILNQQINK
jgi:uncharacterized protein (TIGR00251 family)